MKVPAPGSQVLRSRAAREILAGAIASGVFPAAAVEVGASAGPMWQDALGTLRFRNSSETVIETPFDLASLTKPIVTATIFMRLADLGAVGLDERLETSFGEWKGPDRAHVTVRDLLEHASGLAARLLDRPPQGRREFEHDICTMPLEYAPRTQSVYSDLGFILLGFLAADRGGAPLDRQFAGVAADLEPGLAFRLTPEERRRAAPTTALPEDVRRGRVLSGEVHDSYAAALDGVAGHAGLFGTARAVGAFGRAMLRASRDDGPFALPVSARRVKEFVTRSQVPASSRALGWDTMLPTSSCGTRMSASAFGHVGFTGTSLWIDPERDRYFVLLTNRAFGAGTLDEMRTVRRAFHDVVSEL